jgi:HEAT repeat protein
MSLGELGAAAKVAVPALAIALADKNLSVRYFSGRALTKLGPDAREAVPALIAALRTFPGGSPELEGPERYFPDVRSVAAEALGAIGPMAKAAIPALKVATTDANWGVKAAAEQAIEKIAIK